VKKNKIENSHLKNRTTEKLQSKLYVHNTIAITLVIVLTLLTVLSIYGLIAKDNTLTFIALFAVACTSWSFLPLPFNSMKEIKTELKLREHTI
jgi:heme/copper-type cytochrome/quinol oxidase subunit 4